MISKINITLWGRDFLLDIDYDIFDGEEVLPEQVEALKSFITHKRWLDDAKQPIIVYCKKDVQRDDTNEKKYNIFSYIKPDYIFVKNADKKNRVALMCRYRYDEEHGIAIVFDDKGQVTVGSQDIIL